MQLSDLDELPPALHWKVFTARRPGLVRDVPRGLESLMWVANSATLIYGDTDAVLVDTFLTIDQSRMLVDAVVASGKNLTTIYVTHAHGDHFFGIGPLLQRFPQARAVAMPEVVRAAANQIAPDYLASFWRKAFPGQIADHIPLPDILEGNIDLEGHKLIPIELGHTDTPNSTCLHMPLRDLVVAGDAVYNGIHPYLGESTPESRDEWLAALAKIESLEPRVVVAGPQVPDANDSPLHVEQTRRYLQDFIRLEESAKSARELFDAMLALYPDRANPGSLWGAAQAAKRTAAAA